MKKKYLILFFIFAMTCPVFSAAGKSGWWIFRRPQSSKPKALPTLAMVRGDLSGVFYNPSVLGSILQREVFFMSELGMGDDAYGGLLYGHPLSVGSGAGASVGVIYYTAGQMSLYWMEGGRLQEKSVTAQKDLLVMCSYGQNIADKFYVGGTLKFADSTIAELKSAMAVAADLGAMYPLPQVENLMLSCGVLNLGTATKFITKAESLPVSLWTGLSYAYLIDEKSYLAIGLEIPFLLDDSKAIPSMGLEYGFSNFAFNIGYRLWADDSILSAGFMVKIKDQIDLGYSFQPATYLENTHRLSLGYRF